LARLVIVSNRVPLPSERGPRAGGLTVALQDAIKAGGLWFGWSGSVASETSKTARLVRRGPLSYATIDLSRHDYDRFYVGFANSTLWPLLHYRLGLIEFDRENFDGYVAVNSAFANALSPYLRASDLVWVHDYHLIPLASRLRELGIKNRLGFFLHVPFVPAGVLDAIPRAKELLRMLCGYDVVGFQTQRSVDDFLSCVRRILGAKIDGEGRVLFDNHVTTVVVNPAGIHAEEFTKLAEAASRGPDTKRMMDSLVGRALIIGIDRLDYSKGLPHRFHAFARLLARFPEHRAQVSFLQIAPRSREEVTEYQRLKRDLDRLTGEINGRFADIDWVPLRYITRPMSRASLAGLLRIARVGLVTPLRDGMNLVAKEFVAAQDPTDPGVLVLSQFAGAADQLTEAILVNPIDADEVAEALHQALTMPLDERLGRYEALRAKVSQSSAERFCSNFLSVLAEGTAFEAPDQALVTMPQ
jgi:trehalose 6-phosphate synthase